MESRIARRAVGSAAALMILSVAACVSLAASAKRPFNVSGQFVEGCSCQGVCPCDITGLMNGCQGVGIVSLTSGRYNGQSLAGAKVAYSGVPGDWLRLYVDARTPRQRAAATAFARAAFSPLGKIEAVKDAPITLVGRGGRYTVTVDGGRIMQFSTVPVLGGDRRTPIIHANTKNPLVPSVMQGKTVRMTYKDGPRAFQLQGTNAYFNDRVQKRGQI